MAGGMNKKGTGLPAWLLAANQETRAAAEEAMRQRRPTRQIHCWVRGTVRDHAALALEWRRAGAGWQALVAYETGGGDFCYQWLDAEQLEPYQPNDAQSEVVAPQG